MTYYHVCQEWDGGDLLPLARRLRDEGAALDAYADRWPEAGELAQYHVHWVHLYDTFEQAQDHVDEFGGQILRIEPDEFLTIERDPLEFDHPVYRGVIPAAYISRI